jgi:DNA-binding MarR family transcriptional regulator
MWQDVGVENREVLVDRLRLLGEQGATQTALFQQAAAASYGLGVTDMRALSIILREGPQTAGALAIRLHLTSGAITGVIDRLKAAGLARRDTDEHDRRRILVSADLDGLATGENVYERIGTDFDEFHESLTLAELRFLVRYLEASLAITTEHTAALAKRTEGHHR